MDGARFEQVNVIFNRVCAAEPDTRDALIDELSAGDPALAGEVRSLLAVEDSIPAYLEDDSVGANAAKRFVRAMKSATRTDIEHPDRIGRYDIIGILGQGGMGVVYRARQRQPIVREVALKVIRPGMDSEQFVARFRGERQALAMLDHPGIAHVYDGGVTAPEHGSRPFFAMELVEGSPITAFCDDHHLGVEQRLALFLHVCDAVQHAHQRGIIHRDLKPSNVIVVADDNGGGHPKVIDFGVAKAMTDDFLGQTMYSLGGQFVGTPEYMSPEQADLAVRDIDTRTDVYALGVMLYELLTGRLPFDAARLREAGLSEAQRIIRDEVPPAPSTRLRQAATDAQMANPKRFADAPSGATSARIQMRTVQGDLDWIVMKCLEKERDRRYDSTSALADDIRRHLRNEPVEAGRPTLGYRVRKFARRNRAAVVAGVLVAASLVGGMVATSWQAVRASIAERDASAALEEAQRDRDIAEATSDFLNKTVLAAAGPSIEAGRGRAVTMREVLDAAALQLEEQRKPGGVLAGKPLVAASIHYTLSYTYKYLSEYDRALVHALRANDIRHSELGEFNKDTLLAMTNLASVYRRQGRFADAEPLFRRTIELRKQVLGPEDANTLRSMNNLANLLRDTGRIKEAEFAHRELLEIRRRVYGSDNRETLRSMHNIADMLRMQGKLDAAETEFVRVLELRRQIMGEHHNDTITSMAGLARVYAAQGRLEPALDLAQQTVDDRAALLGADHMDTLHSRSDLGMILALQGRAAEAEALLRDTVERQQQVLGATHPAALRTTFNLAVLCRNDGRPAEAEALFREVLNSRTATLGEDHRATIRAMVHLAATLRAVNRTDEATQLEQRVDELRATYDRDRPADESDRVTDPAFKPNQYEFDYGHGVEDDDGS